MSSLRNSFKNLAQEEGRSKEYIEEILAYTDCLEEKGLPVLFSLKHLAYFLEIEFDDLLSIVKNRNSLYKTFFISKKSGGKRLISVPFRNISSIQRIIKNSILDKIQPHPAAFGFVKEKSILHNAQMHKGQPSILNIDIHDFFSSISFTKVYWVFKGMGYIENLAVDLAKICTANLSNDSIHKLGYLPQGAPTSPVLSNLVMRSLDKRLCEYAIIKDIKYSRYADDITFSGMKENLPKVSFLKKILKEEGFNLNLNKVRLYTENSNRKMVTGLLVGDTIKLPKKIKSEVNRHLYFLEKVGPEKHIAHLDKIRGYKLGFYYDWLKGKIDFIRMVEPEIGAYMLARFNDLDWGIK